jgi:cobaltochelatase CobN
MLTGYGYAAPSPMPEHGIYLPEMDVATFEDWQRQADPLQNRPQQCSSIARIA